MAWEERWHPLREEWVIVAAHRQDRPWSGKTVQHEEDLLPDYVPDCYLCPGNQRVSGKVNGNYTQTFVFDNDYPALTANPSRQRVEEHSTLLRAESERGICRVACFTPRHDLTLATMSVQQMSS